MPEEIPKYKYYKKIAELGIADSCPPRNVKNKEINAFRFTTDDVTHSNTFVPQGIKNPARINHASDRNILCNLISGLSFFSSQEKAIKRFSGFTKQIKKKLGYTSVAFGIIAKTDGTISEMGSEGHFTLYEYESIDLRSKFEITAKLVK